MLIGMQLVAKIRFTTATPPVASGPYRCTVARTANGRYPVTLDEQLDATEGFFVGSSAAASGAAEWVGAIPTAAPNANIWEVTVSTATAAGAETGSQITCAFFRVTR